MPAQIHANALPAASIRCCVCPIGAQGKQLSKPQLAVQAVQSPATDHPSPSVLGVVFSKKCCAVLRQCQAQAITCHEDFVIEYDATAFRRRILGESSQASWQMLSACITWHTAIQAAPLEHECERAGQKRCKCWCWHGECGRTVAPTQADATFLKAFGAEWVHWHLAS